MVTVQTAVLTELEPIVEANLNRHLEQAKPWNPHDFVPWSRGRDFALLGGQDWAPEDSQLDEVAKAAMVVNLLTEDNLPSYHREIALRFGLDGAWGQWVGQWTAEEGRHSIAIRDYLMVTRGVDPDALERLRMQHTAAGYDSGDKTVLEALVYVSFQELATRISHRNTGRATGCPVAEQLLTRVATDENLHMVFYRNLVRAALDIAPNATIQAIASEVMNFQMPGAGMPGFAENALKIAQSWDLRSPDHIWTRCSAQCCGSGTCSNARISMTRPLALGSDPAAFLDAVDAKASHYEQRRLERLAAAVHPAHA